MKRHLKSGLIAIYRYICLITMMEYVGQSEDFDKRNREHLCGGLRIDKAIKQFGIENFHKEVIEYVDEVVADNRERFWIVELETRWPQGYNVKPGGSACRGYTHSEEARKNMSEAHKGKTSPNKGKKATDEARLHMSEAKRGEKHNMFGKPRSDTTKKRISEKNKGKVMSEEARRKNGEAHKGQIPWIAGKTHTEQSLEKMRAKAIRGEDHKDNKLTTEQVVAIIADPRSSRKIAKDYGVNHKHILAIKNGTKWKHIPR